jgi:hypothetical protein
MRKALACLIVVAILGSYVSLASAQVADKSAKIVIVVKTPPDQGRGEDRD